MMASGKVCESGHRTTRELDELYDHGYFHGKTSGYAAEGYARAHPDWGPWLELVRNLKPSGVLVDLGCAYGYLVVEAQQLGFRAFGFDISSYALRQQPKLGVLTQAHLAELPIRSGVADVVTLFDVLEHLHDPLRALDEAVRILNQDGLLVGTTPDPVFFDRSEPTHFSERPPSFWISCLEERGLKVQFRFSELPYNFQFLACPGTSSLADQLQVFQHDYFAAHKDFLAVEGRLKAVPRFGWRNLDAGSRAIEGRKAAVYLLNPSGTPQRVRARFHLKSSPDFCTLGIRFNGLPLRDIHIGSEETDQEVDLPEFLVPAGGHHIFLEITTGQAHIRISRLRIESSASSSRELTQTLPFDLYQRYELTAQVCRVVSPKSILDVGGFLGDRDGHLATSADFLQTESVECVKTTDLRHADHPSHRPAQAWNQPFEDGSFDLVVSLDVLEHLPQENRPEYLSELVRLARRWILLGAPVDSLQCVAFEKRLRETVMQGHAFLEEHSQHGLPRIEEVERFFGEVADWTVYRLPNGYLLRWAILQVLNQLYFSLGDANSLGCFNSIYNRDLFPHDQRTPCYRYLWLASRLPLPAGQIQALESLTVTETSASEKLERELIEKPDFFTVHQRLRESIDQQVRYRSDLQFLINERQKLLQLLHAEVEELRSRVQRLETKPLWRILGSRLKKKLVKH